MTTDAPAPLAPGTEVGRYVVVKLLRAGRSAAYEATDPVLQRALLLEVSSDGAEERLRVCRVLSEVTHPNVVTIFDAGPWDDAAFVAMQLVAGEPLDVWARGRGWRRIAQALIEVAGGLGALHDGGVVHRALDTTTVVIDDSGHARIATTDLAGLCSELAGDAVRADERALLAMVRDVLAPRAPSTLRRALATDVERDVRGIVSLLEGALGRGRRVAIAGVSLVAAAAATAGLLAWPDERPSCDALAEAGTRTAWNEPTRMAVRGQLQASGRPHAAFTADRVEQMLDAYSVTLTRTRAHVCESTRTRNEELAQSGELDRAIDCLASAQGELAAVARVLLRGDATAVDNAILVSASLRPARECLDSGAHSLVARPPPHLHFAVATLRLAATEVRVRNELGDHRGAAARLATFQADAERLGFAPLAAEVLLLRGWLAQEEGSSEVARDAYRRASHEADIGADDELRALALIGIARTAGMAGDARDVEAVVGAARAAVERLGPSSALAIELENVLVGHALGRGRPDEAVVHAERVVAASEQAFGAHDVRTAKYRANLVSAQVSSKPSPAVLTAATEAASSLAALLGSDHPDVVTARTFVARALTQLGKYPQALAAFREIADARTRIFGPNFPGLSKTRVAIGNLLELTHDLRGAVVEYRAALALIEREGNGDTIDAAQVYTNLGGVTVQLGDYPGARAQFAKAIAIGERAHHPILVAHALEGTAESLNLENAQRDSLPLLIEARRLRRTVQRDDHPEVLLVSENLGETYLDLGDPGAAIGLLEETYRLRVETAGADTVDAAYPAFILGRALWVAGRERARSHRLVTAARDVFDKAGDTEQVTACDAWLADHPRPVE